MSKIHPARGHMVEKTPSGRKERTTYSIVHAINKRKRKKYSEKATSPNKQKKKGKKHVWLSERLHVCMYGHTYSKSMDQPGKVASPARGQLNRENEYFSVRVRA